MPGRDVPEFIGYGYCMLPQKTQPAQVITDGDDRLTVPGLMGILHHILDELHDQNKTLALLTEVVEEARPLLESPVAKFMAQRRAFKHPKATP